MFNRNYVANSYPLQLRKKLDRKIDLIVFNEDYNSNELINDLITEALEMREQQEKNYQQFCARWLKVV